MKVTYRINGAEVSEQSFDDEGDEKVTYMLESRIPPGGHQTCWESFTSDALGVGAGDEAAHAAWMRSQGVRDVEQLPGGAVRFGSEAGREQLMKAKNVADFNSAGSGEFKGVSTPERTDMSRHREQVNAVAAEKNRKAIAATAREVAKEVGGALGL